MEGCEKDVIDANYIQKLKETPECFGDHVLRMNRCGSFNAIERRDNVLPMATETFLEELEPLKQLNNLSITIRSYSVLHKFISSHKFLSCILDLSFQYFRGSSSVNISSLENMTRLLKLDITDCAYLKELTVDWSWNQREEQAPGRIEGSCSNMRVTCFHSLRDVHITTVPCLTELSWLIFAPNLAILKISESYNMQKVIQRGCQAPEVVGNPKLFSKLEVLVLNVLPRLVSICSNALPFPYLKKICVRQCPLLKKLPLGSNSLCRGKIIIEGEERWWYNLQWEDEATRNTFIPSFRSLD